MIEHDGDFYFTKEEILGFDLDDVKYVVVIYEFDEEFTMTKLIRTDVEKWSDLDDKHLYAFETKFITAKECLEEYDNDDLIGKTIISIDSDNEYPPLKLKIVKVEGACGYAFEISQTHSAFIGYDNILDNDLVLLLDDIKLTGNMKKIVEKYDDLVKSKTRKDFDNHVKLYLSPIEIKVEIYVWNPDSKAAIELVVKKEVKENSIHSLADANELLEKLFLIYEKARSI